MRDREYISETHKQRYLLERKRLKDFIFTVLFALFLAAGFYWIFGVLVYTKEDREKLRLIREYRVQAAERVKDPYLHERYMRYLREEEKKIKDKYPFPALWSLGKYPGNKAVFLFFSLLPVIAYAGFYIYAKKKLFPELDRIFLPVIGREEPMELPQKGYDLWGSRYADIEKKFLSSPETVKRLFAALDIKRIKEAEKFIEELSRESEAFLKKYFPYENHKEVLFAVEFLLFHHLASLYGNLPTSLLGKYVKDYNLRKALSLYQRNHAPVIVGINGELLKKEEEAFILCKIFYILDSRLKLRKRLDEKFDPLQGKDKA